MIVNIMSFSLSVASLWISSTLAVVADHTLSFTAFDRRYLRSSILTIENVSRLETGLRRYIHLATDLLDLTFDSFERFICHFVSLKVQTDLLDETSKRLGASFVDRARVF